MAKTTWTTEDLRSLLRKEFPLPQYALVFEVPNGTSNYRSRTCDALAVGCWKSVGIELIGMELKVSRSDWTKELQQPEKSESFRVHCDRWYIVAPKEIVRLEELPANWGLMSPTPKGSLRIQRPCPVNENRVPVDTIMLAGIMRTTLQQASTKIEQEREVAEAVRKAVEDATKSFESWSESRSKHLKRRVEELEERIRSFQQETGLEIGHFRNSHIGQAVRAVRRMQDNDIDRACEAAQSFIAAAEELREAARILQETENAA